MGRLSVRTACLAAAAVLGAVAWADAPPDGIPLDIAADFAPVLCGDRLYVFSSGGRNQMMAPGDPAPNCDPVQFSPALQPVCGAEGPLVLDKEGKLWQLGKGFPITVQEGLKEPVALLPRASGLAIVFKDRMLLPDGKLVPLTLAARGAVGLEDGGFWVWGESRAERRGADGNLKWAWSPRSGSPGPAVLSGKTLYAGTSRGELVALRDGDGWARFRYKGGGEVVSPPVVVGGRVLYASLDHFVRCVETSNGLLAWQSRCSGRPAFGPIPVKAGFLFGESAGSRLFILSAKNGQRVWEWRAPAGSILQSPAVAGESAAVLVWGEESTPTLYRLSLPAIPEPEKGGKK